MSDNTTLPATGEVIATDDIGGGVKVQRAKVGWGPDGTYSDADTASGKPLPVQLRDSDGTDVALSGRVGGLTESAPANDTASSGLNGRLQRIAQRLTSLIGLYTQEDVAIGDGANGLVVFAKRSAAPANTSGTDGDAEPLQVSDGLLWTAPLAFPFSCSTDITRPNDTNAYVANDAWSDSTSAPTTGGFTFTNSARKSGGSVLITDMWIASSNPAGGLAGEIWIFDQAVTNINDNAAFAISDSEIKTVVAKIPFVLVADANNAGAHIQNINAVATASGSANLRFLVKVKAAYTPAANEVLTAKIKGLRLD